MIIIQLYILFNLRNISNTDLYGTYFVQNYILTSLDSFHIVFNYIIFRIVN